MKGSDWEYLVNNFYAGAGRDWPFKPPAVLWYQEWWIGYGKWDGCQARHYTGNINNYQAGVLDGMASDNIKKWRKYEQR